MSSRWVILGAPGAGKGTQAQRLCGSLGLEHLSTGDLLRAAVAGGTEAGRTAERFMKAGELVPDEVVFEVLFERLGEGVDEFLLDGFPRNRTQAEELDRRLGEQQAALDGAVEIAVPDERLLGRITGRRLCRKCGRNYHVEFMPPSAEGRCDACGGELYQRPDDNEQTVRNRLAVYHDQTAPLLDYYEEQGLLQRVDGDRSPDDVTEALEALLSRGVAETE